LFIFRQPPSGSVLILTVWVMSLLSFLAAGLGSRGIFALGVSERLHGQLKATTTAEGGAQIALALMQKDPTPDYDGPAEAWFQMEDWESLRDPEVSVELGSGLVDEDRKLNLNTAPVEVLQNLFQAQGGLPKDEALNTAEAVADWRDADDNEREHGAEGFTYRGLSPGYDCKNGPLESVEELLLVKGITPQVWTRCEPYVTVYGSGRVNVNTASKAVLLALGLSPQGVSALLAYRAGNDGVEGTKDDTLFRSDDLIVPELSGKIPLEDQNRLTQLSKVHFLGVGSGAFRLVLTAQTSSSKTQVHLTCIVERTGQIKAWMER